MIANCKGQFFFVCAGLIILTGCSTAGKYRENIDRTAAKIIEQKQMEALGKIEPFLVEPPAVTLRRRLMIDQNLQYSNPASLGTKNLEPIEHWPKDDYLEADETVDGATEPIGEGPLRITLIDALQIAAQNSRQYQSSKESLFSTALSLDLRRDQFRNTFTGALDNNISANLGNDDEKRGVVTSGAVNLSRRFLNGITLSARIGMDLVKLLYRSNDSSKSLFGDASITIPLLRGAGRHIVAEPLLQSERNMLYAIHDFERYKRTFAVNIAQNYLSVLQQIDSVKNAEDNYKSRVRTARFSLRLGDAGDMDPIQVDQAIQQQLSAREGWIRSKYTYQRRLDSFKVLLGLPADSKIELVTEELERLAVSAQQIININLDRMREEEIPPADAEIVLRQPTMENAGPMELDEEMAIRLAFENRLDLRTIQGEVYDAQRAVVVAADDLRAELTLLGSVDVGEGRSVSTADEPDRYDLNFQKGRYNALLTLDLPFERTAEIIAYRNSLISLERAVRNLQDLEDTIKTDIRNLLRDLLEAREGLQIQALAVELAQNRVRSTNISLEAGRIDIRDLLEAQTALLSAQDDLTNALVNYRVAELQIQRDLGLLEVNEKGLWKEFSPEELNHE